MPNLGQIVAVLVIAGMGGFDVVYLVPQRSFQRGVILIRAFYIRFLCRVGSPHHDLPAAAQKDGAGRERGADEQNQKAQNQDNQDALRMLLDELHRFFGQGFRFLCSAFCLLRRSRGPGNT